MAYDYRNEMAEDIRNYIVDNYTPEEIEEADGDELFEKLNDVLWVEDSVTGNASGSYTFNTEKAKEYVVDNMDLVEEMASEFGVDNSELGEKFRNGDWEWFDVSIRCYLLGEVLGDVLREMGANY